MWSILSGSMKIWSLSMGNMLLCVCVGGDKNGGCLIEISILVTHISRPFHKWQDLFQLLDRQVT